MPRDGSGNYTLPVGNPVITDTLIETDWANSTLSDIAVQLNNVITRDGVLGPISPFKLVDGAVATPGLAFNSEPGLGWYRIGTSRIGMAAVNALVYDFNASAAADVNTVIYPRAAGETSLRLNRSTFGTADTSYLKLSHNATESRLESVAVGAGVMGPIVYQATLHKFHLTDATVFGQFSRPSVDSARLTLNKHTTAASASEILGSRNGLARWKISLGDSTTESGSFNIGSNFLLENYDDAGSLLSVPIEINRDVNGSNITFRTKVLSVISPLSPFASALSIGTGFPGVNNPNTTINGNLIYNAWGYTGAVSKGKATFNGDIDFTNNADPGRLIMAPVTPMTWNTYATSGSIRFVRLFSSGVIPSYGSDTYGTITHTPGTSATFEVTVNAEAAFVMWNDGHGASSGGWVATSDRRVKENLSVISGALGKILSLTGYTYDKMDMVGMDGSVPRKAGYIAQDVQKVLPEAISVANDEIGTLSVDHNGLIGLLIEAVKEQNARIDQLEAGY